VFACECFRGFIYIFISPPQHQNKARRRWKKLSDFSHQNNSKAQNVLSLKLDAVAKDENARIKTAVHAQIEKKVDRIFPPFPLFASCCFVVTSDGKLISKMLSDLDAKRMNG
jgi:hypothetical protein